MMVPAGRMLMTGSASPSSRTAAMTGGTRDRVNEIGANGIGLVNGDDTGLVAPAAKFLTCVERRLRRVLRPFPAPESAILRMIDCHERCPSSNETFQEIAAAQSLKNA
jgi:hypothetical protein